MPRLLLMNNSILFLCCSIYLGTGISLLFFQFPLEAKLTIDTYYLVFVEPVANATSFFTTMTKVMLFTGVIMLFTEWFSGLRWIPVIVLLTIIIATLLTLIYIFPHNEALSKGITDPQLLKTTLASWMDLNRIRVALWAIQWSAMMYYFYKLARKSRSDQ